jgi:hypothetical protein
MAIAKPSETIEYEAKKPQSHDADPGQWTTPDANSAPVRMIGGWEEERRETGTEDDPENTH